MMMKKKDNDIYMRVIHKRQGVDSLLRIHKHHKVIEGGKPCFGRWCSSAVVPQNMGFQPIVPPLQEDIPPAPPAPPAPNPIFVPPLHEDIPPAPPAPPQNRLNVQQNQLTTVFDTTEDTTQTELQPTPSKVSKLKKLRNVINPSSREVVRNTTVGLEDPLVYEFDNTNPDDVNLYNNFNTVMDNLYRNTNVFRRHEIFHRLLKTAIKQRRNMMIGISPPHNLGIDELLDSVSSRINSLGANWNNDPNLYFNNRLKRTIGEERTH